MSEPQVIPSLDALIEQVKGVYPYWVTRIEQVHHFMKEKAYMAVGELLYPDSTDVEPYYSVREIVAMASPNGVIAPERFAELVGEADEVRAHEDREPLRQQLFADFCHTYPVE